MRKLLSLLGAVALCSAPVHASLILYEPFNYSTNPDDPDTNNATLENNVLVSTGEDWDRAGSSTVPSATIIPGNLPAPAGLPDPIGNKATWGAIGTRSDRLNFPAVNTGSIYYSLLFQATDLSSQYNATTQTTSPTGSFFAAFNNGNADAGTNTAPSVAVGKIQVRRDASEADQPTGTKFNIGVGNNGGAGDTVWSDDVLNVNETYMVIVGYTFVDGTGNDVGRLWLNPNLGTFDPNVTTPTASVTGFDIAASPGILSFIARQTGGLPTVEVDELRIGTTYQSVIPEPSAFALGGLALLALTRRIRRPA